MPLSRIAPRKAGDSVARIRSSATDKNQVPRHLRLWEAIRRTREELSQWRRQVKQVEGLFREFIAPREQRLTDEVIQITECLVAHFANKDLSVANRSLLGLWITENLRSLINHPFASASRTAALQTRWRSLISMEGNVEQQLSHLARTSQFADSSTEADYALAQEHEDQKDRARRQTLDQAQSRPDANRADRSEQRAGNKKARTSRDANETGHATEDLGRMEKIKALENRLSVDRLFRQLAKVLHPDREPDETRKLQKHILMSECLKARQKKDIDALLNLYFTHVGSLPDDLSGTSHSELIQALEQQLKDLQAELRRSRFADPLQQQIVERYATRYDVDSHRRIEQHADSLDREINRLQLLSTLLATDEGLIDALDDRRAVELDRLAIDELTGMTQG